MKAIKVRAG